MKFLIAPIYLLLVVSCNSINRDRESYTDNSEPIEYENESTIRDAAYYRSKGFQVFEDYNLAVKTPVRLEDISQKVSGDFDFVYGGFLNPNSNENIAFYQIIIIEFPAGYKNSSAEEKESIEETLVNRFLQGNQEKVVFLEQDAYVGEYTQNGYEAKTLVLIRDYNLYAFNLMTNDELVGKFNTLTNNIKFIED